MAERKKGMKGLIGLEEEEEEEAFGCDYHIDQSGSKKRLVVECTDCNKTPSLNDQECLTVKLDDDLIREERLDEPVERQEGEVLPYEE